MKNGIQSTNKISTESVNWKREHVQEYKFYWRNKKRSFTESAWSERKYIFTDVMITDAPITHVINIFLLELAHQYVKNSLEKCSLFHLNWL
jgi:hypothetical protein